MKLIVGFFSGVLIASVLAILAASSRQDYAHADSNPTADQEPESGLASQDATRELELARQIELQLAGLGQAGAPTYTPRESDTPRDRLVRATGCMIAVASLMSWREVCAAEGYTEIHQSRWKYESMGESIISAPDKSIAWMRCKAEIRPYVQASVRGDALADMKETIAILQWEDAARSMVMPVLSSFYAEFK